MSNGGIPCENSNRRDSHFLADSALQLEGELQCYQAISEHPMAPNSEEWQIHNSVEIYIHGTEFFHKIPFPLGMSMCTLLGLYLEAADLQVPQEG